MNQLCDYCSVVNANVTVKYHAQEVPILGKGKTKGSKYIDDCSHVDLCTVGASECPVFKKLNNL